MKIKTPPNHSYQVLITRPYQQGQRLAQLLDPLAITTILLPTIVIEAVADDTEIKTACAQLANYDLAIFQSRYAVAACAPYLKQSAWPHIICAVGAGTAEALQQACRQNQAPTCLIPNTPSSEGLLAMPELSQVNGKKIVIFSAALPRPLLADSLRARGGKVATIACYLQQKPSPATLLQLGQQLTPSSKNIVVVTSCRGLDHLWHGIESHLRLTLQSTSLLVTSKRIKKHAESKGFKEIIVASATDNASIISSLQDWLATHSL